jgi:hypothetical protein
VKQPSCTSNVIELNAAKQWTLLSWLEAVSANSKSQNSEMDLERWLAVLDEDTDFLIDENSSEPVPDNVIHLSAYREKRQAALPQAMSSD